MPFVLRDCAGNFTSEIKTRRKNKTNIQYNIKTRKMSKLQKIIKDIVKQQLEFAEKRNQRDDKEFIRQLTYKQLIITAVRLPVSDH